MPATERTQPLGHADSLFIVGDEDGFELHFGTDTGLYVVNVHSVSRELLAAVNDEIGAYWEEGRRLAREHQHDLDRQDAFDLRNAYDPSDPKHPGWSVRVADAYDTMRGDR